MSAAPIKVLVIDDDFPVRELLRRQLKPQSYDVIEASSSKIAVELLAKQPAVVILDPGHSDFHGHALLRMIRGWNDNVPIVVLCNRSDEAGKVQALDLGANDYITKPFGIDELLARLRVALRHQLQSLGVSTLFRAEGLTVDLVRHIVTADGRRSICLQRNTNFCVSLCRTPGRCLLINFRLANSGAIRRMCSICECLSGN
jgi:two-component system, OmpR family, KDP operon response regulator KdpE